jgi:hypothetical protein
MRVQEILKIRTVQRTDRSWISGIRKKEFHRPAGAIRSSARFLALLLLGIDERLADRTGCKKLRFSLVDPLMTAFLTLQDHCTYVCPPDL